MPGARQRGSSCGADGRERSNKTSTSLILTFKIHKNLLQMSFHTLSHGQEENQAGIILGNVFPEETFLDQLGIEQQE